MIQKALGFTALAIMIGFMANEILNFNGQDSLFMLLTSATFLTLNIFILFQKNLTFYHPLILIVFNVFVGIFLRSFYMVHIRSEQTLHLFFAGKDIDHFLLPTLYVFIGTFLMLLAFTLPLKIKPWMNRLLMKSQNSDWQPGRVHLVVFVFLALGVLGTVLFVQRMGLGNVLQEISASAGKKHLQVEGEYKFAALGYYRWLAGLAKLAFYISLIHWLDQKQPLKGPGFWLMIISFLFSIFFPFFTSSRSSLGLIVFNALVIFSVYRKVNPGVLAGLAIFGILVFNYMTQLRLEKWAGQGAAQEQGVLDPLIFNRNLLDISKTGHVIQSVPENLEYKWGSSLSSILVAPIPRTLWPGKPVINVGKEIALKVYNVDPDLSMGIPPGLFAEFYLNFGAVGLIIGMFLFGRWLAVLYKTFTNHNIAYPSSILLYIAFLLSTCIIMLSSSVNQGIIDALQLYIPSWLAIRFMNKPV